MGGNTNDTVGVSGGLRKATDQPDGEPTLPRGFPQEFAKEPRGSVVDFIMEALYAPYAYREELEGLPWAELVEEARSIAEVLDGPLEGAVHYP